jgi:hypothetical protein
VFFLDNTPYPRETPIRYGSAELGEQFRLDCSEPGEILYGVDDPVPPARAEWAHLGVGQELQKVRVWSRVLGDDEFVPGTHWGDGIVLLNRDRDRIRAFLHDDLSTKTQKLSALTLNAILRGFFSGRSYVRLYSFGGSRGTRKFKEPFIFARLEAINRKFEY